MNTSRQPAATQPYTYRSLFLWPPIWFFILLVFAVTGIGFAGYRHYEAADRQEEMRLLSTIAELKVEEITKWREEREGDVEVFAKGPFFVREVSKWLQSGMAPDDRQSLILGRMQLVRRAYHYGELLLLDTAGTPLLSTSPHLPRLDPQVADLVKEAVRTQKTVFKSIARSDESEAVGVIAPLVMEQSGKPKPIGAVFLRIDPSRFLFPLLKVAPSPASTMEVVLVRREGEDLVFLNVPAKGNARILRQPLSQSKLPSATDILRGPAEGEGIDYRGVAVFAALRKIPDADWFLVAKVDQEEIDAPLRREAWEVGSALAALLALTGVAVSLWWRNQRAASLLEQHARSERRLRASSAYSRSLIEASLDPLVTISAEGRITDVNKATEDATGLSRSELIGTDFSAYFTEPEKARTGYERVFEKGFVRDYALALRHKEGRVMDVLYNATVYRDEAGSVLGVFAAARDVTERKRAEDLLEQGRRLIQQIIDNTPSLVYALDTDGRFIFVNRRFASLFKSDLGQLVGNTRERLGMPGQIIEEHRNNDLEIMRTLSESEFEERNIEEDGEHTYMSEKFPLLDNTGKCLGVCGVSTDITERKRMEEELRAASLYARSLIEASLDPFVTISAEGKITDVNKATEDATGLSRSELIGTDFSGYFTEPEKARAGYRLVFDRGFVRDYPLALRHKVGWIMDVLYHASVYRDEVGKVRGVFATARDITERKMAEEEIRRLNAELEQRVASRTVQLEAANKELESFAYSVSHDLRTPLRAIDGFSRMVLKQYEGKLDDEGKRLLNVVRDNTRKMGQLIDDILAFSRAGRLELKTSEVDIDAVVRDVWRELELSLSGREVRLDIQPLPKVQGDAAMLRQVFANLLGNAVKFTAPKPVARIEVSSSTEDNEYIFHVKDNGVGFDMQYMDKLFGVFQRLHGVEEFEGTGIGLAIVKRIIARHGGRVWAEGKVNEGAVFYFSLPISHA